jgi:hypothetical protein
MWLGDEVMSWLLNRLARGDRRVMMSPSMGKSTQSARVLCGPCNSKFCHCPSCRPVASQDQVDDERLSLLNRVNRVNPERVTRAEHRERLGLQQAYFAAHDTSRGALVMWKRYLDAIIARMDVGGDYATFAQWKHAEAALAEKRRADARQAESDRRFKEFNDYLLADIAKSFHLPYSAVIGRLGAAPQPTPVDDDVNRLLRHKYVRVTIPFFYQRPNSAKPLPRTTPAPKEATMSMSKDRIEFCLYSTEDYFAGTARAAVRAFGFTDSEAHTLLRTGRRIRCRPSQFGRFMVFRLEEGVLNNQIKLLRPIMVAEPVEIEQPVDVSKRAFD